MATTKQTLTIETRIKDLATKSLQNLSSTLSTVSKKGIEGFKKLARAVSSTIITLSQLGQLLGQVSRFMGALGRAMLEPIRLAIEQEKAEAKLGAVLKSTGEAAGFNADELKRMASAMQDVTYFGDETVMRAQSLLLTFTNIKKEGGIFEDALQSVLDMSAALDMDLKQQAIQVGKALNDPVMGVSALSRVGVVFTDQTKETIKTLAEMGNVMAAQKIIMAELKMEFGGMAEELKGTFFGAVSGLSNAWGDMLERLGDFVIKSEPVRNVIDTLTDKFLEFSKALRIAGADGESELSQQINDVIGRVAGGIVNAMETFVNVMTGIAEFFLTAMLRLADMLDMRMAPMNETQRGIQGQMQAQQGYLDSLRALRSERIQSGEATVGGMRGQDRKLNVQIADVERQLEELGELYDAETRKMVEGGASALFSGIRDRAKRTADEVRAVLESSSESTQDSNEKIFRESEKLANDQVNLLESLGLQLEMMKMTELEIEKQKIEAQFQANVDGLDKQLQRAQLHGMDLQLVEDLKEQYKIQKEEAITALLAEAEEERLKIAKEATDAEEKRIKAILDGFRAEFQAITSSQAEILSNRKSFDSEILSLTEENSQRRIEIAKLSTQSQRALLEIEQSEALANAQSNFETILAQTEAHNQQILAVMSNIMQLKSDLDITAHESEIAKLDEQFELIRENYIMREELEALHQENMELIRDEFNQRRLEFEGTAMQGLEQGFTSWIEGMATSFQIADQMVQDLLTQGSSAFQNFTTDVLYGKRNPATGQLERTSPKEAAKELGVALADAVANQMLASLAQFIFQSLMGLFVSEKAQKVSMTLATNQLSAAGIALNTAGAGLNAAALALQTSAAIGFAKGGVMPGVMKSYSNLPVHTYAQGGIANTPQLAVFGEGRGAEAFVPLPDGRTIPVTMQNASPEEGGGGAVNVNFTVNAIDSQDFDLVLARNQDTIVGIIEDALETNPSFRNNVKS